MLLLTLGKVMAVLAVGGGGVATYYLVSKKETVSLSSKAHLRQESHINTCKRPFTMKTTEGITMEVNSEQEGLEFLREHYQGRGTVEKCPNRNESK